MTVRVWGEPPLLPASEGSRDGHGREVWRGRGSRALHDEHGRVRHRQRSWRDGAGREHRGQCGDAERGAYARHDRDHRGQRMRARDRWPTNYTTLSGIKSNPTLSLNGSASFGPLGLGNAPMPFAGSSASVARNESANAEYSVNPFSNNDKTQGLLKPIQPEQMQNYWLAGWPRETLMWLFVDAVTFAGEAQPWYIDGDEFSAAPSAVDVANTARYFEIIRRAKRNEIDFGPLPSPDLDQRNCKPYDPAYLRETLGGATR